MSDECTWGSCRIYLNLMAFFRKGNYLICRKHEYCISEVFTKQNYPFSVFNNYNIWYIYSESTWRRAAGCLPCLPIVWPVLGFQQKAGRGVILATQVTSEEPVSTHFTVPGPDISFWKKEKRCTTHPPLWGRLSAPGQWPADREPVGSERVGSSSERPNGLLVLYW